MFCVYAFFVPMEKTTKLITKTIASLHSREALRKFSLALNIRRYTTDSNGAVLADAAVPASEKKAYPFHLFGEFDRQSGYAIADLIASERAQTILFGVYVWGNNTPLFVFNPLATINNQMKRGDVIFVYVDNYIAPNFFTFIVVSAQQGGFASLCAQSNIAQIDDNGQWRIFKFVDIQYAWIDDEQLTHPIFSINTRFNSAYKFDTYDPLAFQQIQYKRNTRSIVIPIEMILNQYIGLTSFLAFENSVLNLTFNLYL